MRVAPLRVWKCLKVPEGTWKCHNKSEKDCIVLAFSLPWWEFTEAYLKGFVACPRSKRQKEVQYEDLDWTIVNTGQGLALMAISRKQRKDHFWSVMLMMFHWCKCILLARTETICWTIQKRGMMWRFGFPKMIFYKQQEQYVLTTVKEIKYFLWKCW